MEETRSSNFLLIYHEVSELFGIWRKAHAGGRAGVHPLSSFPPYPNKVYINQVFNPLIYGGSMEETDSNEEK